MADLTQVQLPNGNTYDLKDNTKVAKAGDTMTGNLTLSGAGLNVNATNGNYYNEGIRINKGGNGYSALVLGTDTNSTIGTQDGAWWIGVNNSKFGRKLMIAHNGSGASTTYFYASSESQVSPALRLGTSGTITSENTDAVTGGVVYTALQNYPTTDTKNTAGSTDTSSKIFLIGATSQAANPQTYSDDQVYVTDGVLRAKQLQATTGAYVNTNASGDAGGVSLYGTNAPSDYGITMRNSGTASGQLGTHGYVTGDWAGYLCFTGATNRGWIFRQAGNNVASIGGTGNAVFNGSVTVGGNADNTSGCRMEFNTTTQSVDFVFN